MLYKFLLSLFCKIISIVYPYAFVVRNKQFFSILYTFWLSREFKSISKSTLIYYPISLVGAKFISIGKNTVIGSRTILTAWEKYRELKFSPQIIIGDNTSIGEDCHITSINKIQIGNNVLLGKKITITDNSHGSSEYEMLDLRPMDRPLVSKGQVTIENGVWIGDKATILSGVCIGENSIIGANSVVTSNIPSFCVAVGVPAKIIKYITK